MNKIVKFCPAYSCPCCHFPLVTACSPRIVSTKDTCTPVTGSITLPIWAHRNRRDEPDGFPLTGNGVAEYDNLSIPFNGSGDAYGTRLSGSYEFLACNKDVNILGWAPPPPSATVFRRNRGKITAERGYAYSSSVTGTVMTDDTLHVTCESKLMVQRIVFNITVTNTGILEYTGITAELDGVTTNRYVRTRGKGSGFATLPSPSPERRISSGRKCWCSASIPG